ncbi:MAG: amino acid permease-domain-containing protein [Benniella sp.]|nr:MAG: amino acid permease-domain-containing protein [Benniella sp.]
MSQPPKKRHAPSSSIGSLGSSGTPSTSRPKTAYQPVTWKEGLDAFNRRLRRGSVSMDMTTQEDDLGKPLPGSQDHRTTDLDEHSTLLGNQGQLKPSYGVNETPATRTTHVGHTAPENGRSNQDPHAQGHKSEPAFPTQLNPVLASTKSSKLGTISGVFVPCWLSIWGIILFLRFGFIIGQAGVMGTMGMFIVGYLINIFTTLSLSAISTNGTVRGGGVYYLVSRSLGPEFGGSIGMIYFLCTVIGCGMNVLGFVEPLLANFGEASGTVYRVLPESPLWGFIYGTILLVSCTLVCLVGAKLFARASMVLAVFIFLSTLSIFVSFAVMPPFSHPERNIVYTGFSWETLEENMWPRFTSPTGPEGPKQSFQTIFGVLFPACIGILAGASMSGDLEDPSKSIPKGTLWAVGSTFCVYTSIVILMGGSISRSTMYTDLSVLQDVSVAPLFIAAGALAASVFATLGSVIGAAKILQAIARDNLLPLSFFSQGTPSTDEPTLAVLLTYMLSQFCLFLTDMNAIATFVSLITLLTYLILNLACFLLKIGSAPNFRPSFRYFRWWTAFSGMVLCAAVMCYVDPGQSLLSGLLTAALFIWIHYWSPPKRWGDVTQSLIYHQVRKYLLRLDSRKEHVKFWRPQILLLVHHPRSEYQLIQFCNHLKKGALYVLGHVILGDLRDVLQEYRRQQSSWLKFVDVLQIKAFVNISVADSVRIGARNLLMGTGLGGMRPNIVVLGSFNLQRYQKEKQQQEEEQRQQQQSQEEYKGKQQRPTSPEHFQPSNLQKGAFTIVPNMDTPQGHHHHHHVRMPASLPIDNIRVEAPISITDYVSVIEDVLSLNKAVAIAYGFDRLELPEERGAGWRLSHLRSSVASDSLRPSSPFRIGDSNKKKYIDLWPMQMSITPLQGFDPVQQQQQQQPSAANLTNFDTYAMVLQMGCILHMVPQWRDNYILRVMVFVEYMEDVEEEERRLGLLLDNLRIPAEIKVICLDNGDSETYTRLVKGEMEDDYLDDERSTISHMDHPHHRQQSLSPLRVDTSLSPRRRQGSPLAVLSAHPSSSQHRHYSSGGGLHYRSAAARATSPTTAESRLGTSVPLGGGSMMNFRIAVPLPKQYLDTNGLGSESDSESGSSEDDALEDMDWPLQSHHQRAQSQIQPRSPRLLQPQPLFQQRPRPLSQPVPQFRYSQYQPSQQASTTTDSQPPPQQQPQSPHWPLGPSALARTSLGSSDQGLGFSHHTTTTSSDSEQDTLGPSYSASSSRPQASSPAARYLGASASSPHRPHQLPSSSLDGIMENPWSGNTIHYPSSVQAANDGSVDPGPGPGPGGVVASSLFGSEAATGPVQFDHLDPETQLMILNELMRIHSSAETTSILFTTVPAPEEGTCLTEENSLAYMEKLDLLMDGIDVPVLLLHAKSLTVTMTL